MADSRQTGYSLERYLKKGQYSSCSRAGVPCAVAFGLDKKSLGIKTEDPAAICFLILSNNTPSWLILQGSFVPQNSQR